MRGDHWTWVREVGCPAVVMFVEKVEQVDRLVEAGISVVEGSRQCCV